MVWFGKNYHSFHSFGSDWPQLFNLLIILAFYRASRGASCRIVSKVVFQKTNDAEKNICYIASKVCSDCFKCIYIHFCHKITYRTSIRGKWICNKNFSWKCNHMYFCMYKFTSDLMEVNGLNICSSVPDVRNTRNTSHKNCQSIYKLRSANGIK